MNTIKKAKIAVFALFVSVVAISCLPKNESIGDAGTTFVRMSPADYNMLAFDAKAVTQSGILFEIRKDVVNSTDLNGATSVTVLYDTDGSLLSKYNTANGTSFIPLPSSLGTVSPAITGGAITLNFAAGDFAQPVTITVPNAGAFDFSKHYALAFKVGTITGVGKLSAEFGTTIVCEVLAKNRWDGIYTVNGTFSDAASSAYISVYPSTIELRTIGSNTCTRYDADYGSYGYLFDTGAGASYYGNFYPAFEFDPATNKVARVFDTYADPLPRGRSGVLNTTAGVANSYNPTTKTMDVAFYMRQESFSPQLRVAITEHYAYKGPR